jgi:hypothetical protein
VLAGEFQWVVSKAETAPKLKAVLVDRHLRHAPIRSDQDTRSLSGEERGRLIQQLFETYLRTIDDLRSLDGQSNYEVGSTDSIPPSQPDSAPKFMIFEFEKACRKS